MRGAPVRSTAPLLTNRPPPSPAPPAPPGAGAAGAPGDAGGPATPGSDAGPAVAAAAAVATGHDVVRDAEAGGQRECAAVGEQGPAAARATDPADPTVPGAAACDA